jgi:hypothetical protein
MSLFQKAAEASSKKSSKTASKSKKSTTWLVGAAESDRNVSKAVKVLNELNADKKAIDAKMKVHKTIVQKHARGQFFDTFAANGVFPETPMLVQNEDGEKVTFVVQDRSSQYRCKQEQLEMLIELLGPDAARGMVIEETTFSFHREALVRPEVKSVIEKHLEAAISELMGEGHIESFEDVLDVEQKTAFKPGTLQRLAAICGNDSVKMRRTFEALGSSATNFIKV